MAGHKTRLGFSGGDEPPSSDDEEGPRSARTIIGHDIHLPSHPAPAPAAGAPPGPALTPASGVPAAVNDENTEELPPRPSHSGKSKFPALARFFGRWTTGGGFSRNHGLGKDDDPLEIPRNVWVPRIAIFVLAALSSFLAALGVMRMRGCEAAGAPRSNVRQALTLDAAPAPVDTSPGHRRDAHSDPGPLADPLSALPRAPASAAAAQPDAGPARSSRVRREPTRPSPTGGGRSGTPRTPRRPDPLSPPADGANRELLLPLHM